MKVFCAEFVGGIKNLPTWWKNNTEMDVTPEQIIELYNTGNNVMLNHSTVQGTILWVDDRRFTQR